MISEPFWTASPPTSRGEVAGAEGRGYGVPTMKAISEETDIAWPDIVA